MRLPSQQHQPLFHHFARRGLASAVSVSGASSASAAFSEDVKVEAEELYIEVEKQKKPPQPRNGKLDLAYLKAMMNLPPQDLQPLTQLQKMAHVAKNSLVHILPLSIHISNVLTKIKLGRCQSLKLIQDTCLALLHNYFSIFRQLYYTIV